MGRLGRHSFLDHWERKSLDLPDGDALWLVIDGQHCEAFRRRSGGIHWTDTQRILREHAHPDAELRMPESTDGAAYIH